MNKLNTIQKREKLNDVYAVDEKGNGGANHIYHIINANNGFAKPWIIPFQCGPRKEKSSQDGVLDTDLLEIVRHRLQCFQAGPYSSKENAIALTYIEMALTYMNKRVEDRIERNVLGTNNK
ncbi:ABC transporter ATPase [Clostridium algidicarnis]|uniref:ABC transporter ATPase n=1 Tax=Clostridium algidicarnis TaxID=37659 RepID=UPI001C0E4608|nr:ABC transporter ATPase [Clostridium algidicarnis]MBU3205137.1 ABC transporter ATPase [Clostridium algidicarnis]MBU3213290.1 ABC transporter ATPase [Clostridium algidicarnis]MBU3223815.1 ABC transporter ATPase [Clostridium algidicarnis]